MNFLRIYETLHCIMEEFTRNIIIGILKNLLNITQRIYLLRCFTSVKQ